MTRYLIIFLQWKFEFDWNAGLKKIKGQLISEGLLMDFNMIICLYLFLIGLFLDSSAEFHQIVALFFLENWRHLKVILRLTDLYNAPSKKRLGPYNLFLQTWRGCNLSTRFWPKIHQKQYFHWRHYFTKYCFLTIE